MPKYKIVYKTSNIFETDDDVNFYFEKAKVFLVVLNDAIETASVELDAANEQDAEERSDDIMKQLNNFWRYLFGGTFLVPEPLKIEYVEKPNGKRTVSASLCIKRSTRGKVNIDDLKSLYRKKEKDKKFRQLLNFFGDVKRFFGWEFLQLYKIVEFEKSPEEREELISKGTGLKRYERESTKRRMEKSKRGKFLRTDLTYKRIDMAHNLCPDISRNDLETMDKLARKMLRE